MPHLHIFTLTWDACEKLKKLKDSLLPALQDIGCKWTWHIKDNASKDNTYEVASSWENENIKITKYKDNRQNFSEGMNYLFNSAKPNDEDYILLLNNDVTFNDNNSIKKMMELFEDKNVGVVGARLLYTGTNRLQHAGVVFEPIHRGPTHYRCNEESDSNAEKNRYFQAVTGAVLLTKAEYYRQVCTDNKSGINGMNEKLIWAFDDIDLTLCINYKLNKKIVYCGKTNISHEESASLKKNPANKLFMNHNWNVLRERWGSKIIIDKALYEKNPKLNLMDKK